MDRFIDFLIFLFVSVCQNLKSNMDRFIGFCNLAWGKMFINLKSNIDRFIGRDKFKDEVFKSAFKIQYG